MKRVSTIFRHSAKRWVAIAIIIGLLCLSRLPQSSAAERSALAARFHFTQLSLPEPTGAAMKRIRAVHPSLARHSAWISAVGAAVALNDLDGDGLPNDVCHVDPRTDQVIVSPVPGTGDRYPSFALESKSLPYDAATMAPMGCVPNDLNEDGRMDMLVYYWGRTPIAFLQSTPSAGMSADRYVAQEIDSSGDRWYTNAATVSDLDGDGHGDLVIGNYFPDGARILDAHGSGTEVMQDSMTRAFNGGRNRLLRWQGATSGKDPAVQFQEMDGGLDTKVNHAWTLAVGAADLDGDLRPELYFANDFGPDRLLHNRSTPGKFQFALLEGQKRLTTPNSKVLGKDSFKGMGVDFGDVNGDGLLDIYVSNIAGEYALEESHFLFVSTGQVDKMQKGVAPYVDRSEPLGVSRSSWSWETKFGDFDNDGTLEMLQATGFAKGQTNRWPELHELAMGNDALLKVAGVWPRFQLGDDLSGHAVNPFFVRTAKGRYENLAQDIRLGDTAVTRGIATADVDGDGDLDFAVANQWERSYFYRNDSASPGKSLELHLLLPTESAISAAGVVLDGLPSAEILGRPAIGAQATVHLPNGRQLIAQVDGGNGHSGNRSSDLHFGLGKLADDTPLAVDLQWRDAVGEVHHQSLSLSPGWHELRLGDSAKTVSTIS
jgi:enediyne biosynthesis protein E4